MPDIDETAQQSAMRLARDAASLFPKLVLLHCEDAATQALVYPEQPDLAEQRTLNRTIAQAVTEAGAEVFAQVVDAAAYAAMLDGNESAPCWRKHFRDPARLVQGEAALRLFGVPSLVVRASRPSERAKRRSPADQLMRDWMDGVTPANEVLSAALDAGREGVVEMAVRKVAERYDDEAAIDFMIWLTQGAERASLDPYGTADLFALPFLTLGGAVPDPAQMARGFLACGALGPLQQAEFAPAWFDADDLIDLTPCALRRTLRMLLDGRLPPDLAPVEASAECRAIVLLGARQERYPVPWEFAVEVAPPADDEAPDEEPEDPVSLRHARAFEQWRAATLAANPGLDDILTPAAPSQLAAELDADDDMLDEADGDLDDASPEEVRDFVEMAEAEAGGEPVVGVARVDDGDVELRLYTASGRLLDHRVFGESLDGLVPESLHRLFSRFVTVVSRPPGRG